MKTSEVKCCDIYVCVFRIRDLLCNQVDSSLANVM